MTRLRVGVIGAGIIGLAVARRLCQTDSGLAVTVLEKENRVGAHQTSHNSGVVHAGVYYAPGSLRARLCRRGVELLRPYCESHGIAYDQCGKLVVARGPQDLERLDEIERRARVNGVPGLKRLGSAQMIEIEPHVRGVSALHSPSTAIVDYPAVAQAYADDVRRSGGVVRLSFEVAAITRSGAELRVRDTHGEELPFDRLVACAGLYADRVARLAGDDPEPRLVPFRGEYYRLVPERRSLVRGLIYPVPDPAYPFLGVHFTRRVDGGVDIGPNAVLAFKREGYKRSDFSPEDMLEVARSAGFRRLAKQHWRMGLSEMLGSLSKRTYVARARQYVPELAADDVVPAPSGMRGQAIAPDGSLIDDFRITHADGLVLVRNAPSPAATSSLAIAEYIVEQMSSQL